jgi:hypothetical protein
MHRKNDLRQINDAPVEVVTEWIFRIIMAFPALGP